MVNRNFFVFFSFFLISSYVPHTSMSMGNSAGRIIGLPDPKDRHVFVIPYCIVKTPIGIKVYITMTSSSSLLLLL